MNLSYWEKEALLDKEQILVIGAGIVGLSTAISLHEIDPSLNITILERSTLPLGASTKNAGFACFGSASEILADLESMGEEGVKNTISARYNGLQKLLSRVSKSSIDYIENGGYEMFLENEGPDYHATMRQIDTCNKLVSDAIGKSGTYLEQKNVFGINTNLSLIHNQYEGQLNPYKLVKKLTSLAMISGINILYNCGVSEINYNLKNVIVNGNMVIPYRKLAICTNAFAGRLSQQLDVVPVRNQVLMTEPILGLKVKGCFHFNEGYVYFRNYKNRILLGGGRNTDLKNEETEEFGTTDSIQNYLINFLNKYILPKHDVSIEHTWSGILGVGDTKSTIIKEYKKDHYAGVRMGGMGVAIGTQVGIDLANLIVK